MRKLFIIIISIIGVNIHINTIFSQEHDLLQFSGVVVEMDSLKPVSFTSIIVKNTHRGTISDFYGYFSFVARKKDIIVFSAIGYKKAFFIIPDTLTSNKYSLIQVMHNDTILLKETVIYPWPTKEQFREVFLNTNVPDDDLVRAEKNLEREKIKEKSEPIVMSGSIGYKASMQQQSAKLYWAGQYPPNNLLNPFAWAQFIKMWREGKLKIQKAETETEK
ncbi:MAG: carboxypeptidase-like regulatory domain-containing protein [Bacteroidota bacterium]